MKNIKYLFISLLAVFFIACDDDFETPGITEPVQGTAPVLEGLTEEIDLVLEKKNEGNTIVELNWTDATYADPIGVRYYVQIDTVGNEFQSPLEFDRVNDITTSITVGGLNTLISSRYAPAQMVELEGRIRAFANEDLNSLYSASFSMKVTPYLDVPIPSDLFMFGTATGAEQVTGALKAYGSESVFTKYLKLTKDGLFKFSDKQAENGYDYNFAKFATRSENIEAAGDDAGNFKFTGETGWYAVTADFVSSNLTIAAYETYVSDYPNIYLVGDYNATDPAWSPGTSPELTRKSEGIYSTEVTLKDGANFKFINQQDWDGLDWADAGSDGNTGILAPKGKNNNIAFDGADKTYILTLDLNNGIYKIEEAALYLVGDATEAGWNIDNAIELIYRSSHNAYMGYIPLKSGNFKFFPAKGSWDGGMGRITDTEDPKGGLLGGDNKDIPSTNSSSDFKLYRVAVWFDADADSYKYSVLDAEMTLVGDATPAGWSIDNGFNMVYAGEGKWTTYVDMNATGGFKFFYETGNWNSGYKEISDGNLSLEGGDPNIATPGAGYYKLTMDTYNMTYTKDLIANKKMYLVGSPNGWDINAGIELTWDDTNKEWTLTTDLGADDAFKIFAEAGNWDSGFKFKYEMLNFEGGDPNLSTPDGAGNYTIKFSLANRTLTFTKN